MMMKIVASVLLVALIASNTWWMIGTLDAGLAATHKNESFENQSRNVSDLKEILLRSVNGYSRSEIELLVDGIDEGLAAGNNNENAIYVDLIEFRFENEIVVSIGHSY